MISNLLSYSSSFVLGALHSLEPGHGKSIVALHTSQSKKFSDGLMMLVSLLITHFSLVLAVSILFFKLPNFEHIEWLQVGASIMIIFYGLFLLVKKSKKNDDYLGCSCHETQSQHHNKKSHKEKIWLGILAGLTPCPSVLSPIFISLSTDSFKNIFFYVFSYMLGVIAVFLVLYLLVYIFRNKANQWMSNVSNWFNPHIFSGALMIAIGLFYLFIHFFHDHA